MIAQAIITKILGAIETARNQFVGSDKQFAVKLGISNSQYSNIKNGNTTQQLSDAKWIRLARELGVEIGDRPDWHTANTKVFQIVTAQLEHCQKESNSALLCDLSDIGKTYAAQYYSRHNKNVVYVDCSQVKTKSQLIRFIAKSYGVDHTDKYSNVYSDLVYYIRSLVNPLIILDEAGDLQYAAFLEIKALWNAVEGICGFYMIGADGLKAKIQRAITNKKVGYTEIFSRFGRKYINFIPIDTEQRKEFTQKDAIAIIKANMPEGTDPNKVLRKCLSDDGAPSLRRISKELSKLHDYAQSNQPIQPVQG